MTSLLCRMRSSRIVNGAVSTSTSLQYTQLCVGRRAALSSQFRACAIDFRRPACAAKPCRLSTSWLTFCPKSFSMIEISPNCCLGSGLACSSSNFSVKSEMVLSLESPTRKAKSMRLWGYVRFCKWPKNMGRCGAASRKGAHNRMRSSLSHPLAVPCTLFKS